MRRLTTYPYSCGPSPLYSYAVLPHPLNFTIIDIWIPRSYMRAHIKGFDSYPEVRYLILYKDPASELSPYGVRARKG